ncbi:MAG: ThiF family adenylyltransferase [Anaerolineales bacterium]|nr:ThiF family adenylyltransferase [Anaerolineales bacterium]
MQIEHVDHPTLTGQVAGRLAASILEGGLRAGEQLPAERDLMTRFGVSRATLREALRMLAEHEVLEARPGVGWFVRDPGQRLLPKVMALAHAYRPSLAADTQPARQPPPEGPRRLTVVAEKPLRIPNLHTDRLGTFDFISWWERDKVQAASVLVVGAGALGNEVVKSLALMGVGHLFIVDFDVIEAANLSRSVFFREADTGKDKAPIVAARAKALNPQVRLQYLQGDVTTGLGLGVVRRMDVVIGCLDNREARLALNRFCYWMGKPMVDGAIQELLGLVRVFVPGQGACFECTLTEQARREMSLRYSCPLLARHNILQGKVPTTPTIASIIGSIQAQEALKLIHAMPVEAGKVTHFNGLTNEMHTTAYVAREDCESHWTYGEVVELPARARSTRLRDMLEVARRDLGREAVIELDNELLLSLTCPRCQTVEEVIRPLSEVSFEAGHCPGCGLLRDTAMTHLITGSEAYLDRTLSSIGVPPLHVLRAHNGKEYRFYELTGDLPEALHFSDFEAGPPLAGEPEASQRIRLGEQVEASSAAANPAQGRIVFGRQAGE